MRIDLHIHTSRCGHAEGTVPAYVENAVLNRLDVVAFTDHLPLPGHLNEGGEYAMQAEELAEYVSDVRSVSHSLEPPPQILLGIEADWLPEWRAETVRALASHPFDVVLGSVHFLDGWVFDDPALIDEWEGKDVRAVWERYFAAVADAAASGMFDVMAHVDLIKKFGHRPDTPATGLYEDLAAALADAGVAVEVSSAGLRKPCEEIYPGDELLSALCRAGVPVTTGSDAHRPAEVGAGLAEVAEAVARAGYRTIVYFEQREMREVELSW